MAISNHLVDGQYSVDFATDLAFGGSFVELSQTADGVKVVYTVTGGSAVDTATPGDYEVTYTATDTDDSSTSGMIQTITVLESTTNIDTKFDMGNEDRRGDDIVGTNYDSIVDNAIAGVIPNDCASAYFSELALDPYEVKHSKS